MPRDPANPSSSNFAGEFAPGQVLIGRYRVIALVGQGGMGQVYLADDLVLGQPVALKFLPHHLAEREGGLDRFRAEVRHSREVTHPNVARVHDIGEVAGRHFLTMEFVDGEDLASLVRRIGRLPREKAAEISQQICAGLAESHRCGVLHRDLKPANVMLDGDGRVKITDFGLAVAANAGGEGPVAGTPQYMAPEQLAGAPADERSEVYSLGLLLYELYTGRRALSGRTVDELRREHEEGRPNPPSSVLDEIDPIVDAMLTRCLARDPAQRPANVMEVARGLPGGDPLAAALARGQTPAPELVAAAEAKGALSSRTALLLALGSIVCFMSSAFLQSWYAERDGISYGKAPALLDERAREIFAELTGEAAPEFESHWYDADRGRERLGPVHDEGANALDDVEILLRHVRLASRPFPAGDGFVSVDDPMPTPGDAHIVLGADGQLVSWTRWPASADAAADDSHADWSRLFALAGVDPQTAVPIEADFVPRTFATERRAWVIAEGPLHARAASLNGRPVQFELLEGERSIGWNPEGPPSALYSYVVFGLEVVAAWVAWQNLRKKRAYLSGALVVGAFAFLTHLVLAFAAKVPKDPLAFGPSWLAVTSMSLSTAARVFLFFLALEPFARRHWPGALVSWTRLLERRFRDPAVGREVLVGVFAGIGMTMSAVLAVEGVRAFSQGAHGPTRLGSVEGINGPLAALSQLLHGWGDAVMYTGFALAVLVAFRNLVQRAWLGNVLWVAALSFLAALTPESAIEALVSACLTLTAFLALLTRLGFLSVVACAGTMLWQPLTLQPRDFGFGTGVLNLLLFAAVVVWAYRAAVGAQPVTRSETSR